jgi:hypothetical protein
MSRSPYPTEDRMPNATWVVYSIPMKGSPGGVRAVCEQGEWDAMDGVRPGFFTLVRGGIANEGEAERLARGSAGEVKPRTVKSLALSWPDRATGVLAGGPANAG